MSEAWSENDSLTFLREADCFVPERELLIESFCRLVPAVCEGNLVVDLCCGDGKLTEAILEAVPDVRLLALDGSEAMLKACAKRTARFGDRVEVRWFDLGSADWRRFEQPLPAVFSMFAIHHLEDNAKRQLFGDLAEALSVGGILAIADLIQPCDAASIQLAAWQWDESVRERSLRLRGDLSGLDAFRAARWNHHALQDPDPADKPASLLDQLRWLEEAGLEKIDVHWMKGGLSLFSGRKQTF
jgi:tRNA (cmo5U34)-methyltransferase